MAIEMVKVSDLLKKLVDSTDDYALVLDSEWFRMMAEKSQDGQFATIVRLIQEEGFTDPIGIKKINDDAWEMGNGHHRLTAAILLGLDEIPVDLSSMWPGEGRREDRVNMAITDADRADSQWISEFIEKGEDHDWVYGSTFGWKRNAYNLA